MVELDLLSGINWLIFWSAALVFVLVQSLLVYSAVRFRRSGRQPAETFGKTRLDLIWAIGPAIVMAGFFVFSLQAMLAG